MKFPTIKQIEALLEKAPSDAEAMKHAARELGPAEAYSEYYRHALRDQILAEQGAEAVKTMAGEKIVEKRLERIARASTEYNKAAILYQQAMEVKTFLRVYIAGLKMKHEAKLTEERRTTAEIRANIYQTGS